jgi:hypothetical protein
MYVLFLPQIISGRKIRRADPDGQVGSLHATEAEEEPRKRKKEAETVNSSGNKISKLKYETYFYSVLPDPGANPTTASYNTSVVKKIQRHEYPSVF